jgi:hypothetical protein
MTTDLILATFVAPETISTNSAQFFWLLPLAIAGVVIYKAIKLPQLTLTVFLKEVFTLFAFLICLLLAITTAIFAVVSFLT